MNFLHSKLRNRLSHESMDMLLFIYINARSLRKASGDQYNYDSFTDEEIQNMLLNMEDDLVADVIHKDTDIVDKIDQEDLARLAQPGEFTFLELDMDAVMASYGDDIPDINMAEGDLNSYFNDI
jgi:hypothetical protein